MEFNNRPLGFPPNYTTINDLKKRWLENKEKEKREKEEKEKNEKNPVIIQNEQTLAITEEKNEYKPKKNKKNRKKNKTLAENAEKNTVVKDEREKANTNSVWVKKSVVDNSNFEGFDRKIRVENNSSKFGVFDRMAENEGKIRVENSNSEFRVFDQTAEIDRKFEGFDRLAEINRKFSEFKMSEENNSKLKGENNTSKIRVSDQNSSKLYRGFNGRAEIGVKFSDFKMSDENDSKFGGFDRMAEIKGKNKNVENNSKYKNVDSMVEIEGKLSDVDLTAEIVGKFKVFELTKGKENLNEQNDQTDKSSIKNDQMAENGLMDVRGSNPTAEIEFRGKKGGRNRRNKIGKNDLMAENEKNGSVESELKISDLGEKDKNELIAEIGDLKSSDKKKGGKNDRNEFMAEIGDLKGSDKKKGGKNRGFNRNLKMVEKGLIYVEKSVLENPKDEFGLKNGGFTVENEWKISDMQKSDGAIENKKNLVAEISDLKKGSKNRGFKKNFKMAEKELKFVEKSVLENSTAETGYMKKGGEKKDFGKKLVGDQTVRKGLMDVWKIVLSDPRGDTVLKNEVFSTSKEEAGGIVMKNGDFSSNKDKGKSVLDGPMAEFCDLSISDRKKGDEKGGFKKGGNSGFRGSGKANKGKMKKGVDSSLVWVRKEEKSDDVCVAGNCCEGVLAKAGENEKKPCRGRP